MIFLLHCKINSLSLVTELLLFDNLLERIPPSLFDMSSLEMLNLDKNHIIELPSTVSKCACSGRSLATMWCFYSCRLETVERCMYSLLGTMIWRKFPRRLASWKN